MKITARYFFSKLLLLCVSAIFVFISAPAFAEGDETITADSATENAAPKEKFNAGKMILDHIGDSHEWHFFTVGKNTISLPLPIILVSSKGIDMFLANRKPDSVIRLREGIYAAKIGSKYYLIDEGKFSGVVSESDIINRDITKALDKTVGVYDLSITKNVLQMLIALSLMMWIIISAAKKYKTRSGKAPRGLQNAVEVIVLFIRDGVAKPMLGHKYMKYLPYLLSLFFFILINNLLGLFPAAANVTGNISVTATLALLTFILMMFGSKRHYWVHMVTQPGLPFAVKLLLVPIELISNVLVKPFALMIRLFANMLAGHLIVLSFMSIIFIFAAMSVGAGLGASVFSVAFCIFIYCLELLVAGLQAYIFTILTALFISETTADHSHSDEHAH